MSDPLEPFHKWTKGRPAINPLESGLGRPIFEDVRFTPSAEAMRALDPDLDPRPFRLIERPAGEQAIRALRHIVDSYDARSELFPDNAACAGTLAAHARLALDLIAAKRAGDARGPRPIWGELDLGAPSSIFVGSLVEIATALSRLARFNGWGPRFYSVAEHSILCDEIARAEGVPAVHRRAVLMHDAAEVYVGDAIRPLKVLVPELQAIEDSVLAAIAERFDVPIGFRVAAYDDLALAVELRELFPDDPREGLPDPGIWQAPRLEAAAAALEFVRRAEALGLR